MQSGIMENEKNKIKENLRKAGIKKSVNQHVSKSAKVGIVGFVLSWLLFNLFSEDVLIAVIVSMLFGIAVFAYLVYSPKRKLKKEAQRIDATLPFALMQLSVELNTGIQMQDAVKRIGDAEYGLLSEKIRKAIAGAKKGSSLPKEMSALASDSDSRYFKRAIAQMIAEYEHGSKKDSGEVFRRLGLEGLARQKAEAKEFSGKLVMLSLAFIVMSAILPALFQAFIIVGSAFIEIDFTAIEVLLIITVLFPMADTLLLFYIKASVPESMKAEN